MRFVSRRPVPHAKRTRRLVGGGVAQVAGAARSCHDGVWGRCWGNRFPRPGLCGRRRGLLSAGHEEFRRPATARADNSGTGSLGILHTNKRGRTEVAAGAIRRARRSNSLLRRKKRRNGSSLGKEHVVVWSPAQGIRLQRPCRNPGASCSSQCSHFRPCVSNASMTPSKMSPTPIAETKKPTIRVAASIPSGPSLRVSASA